MTTGGMTTGRRDSLGDYKRGGLPQLNQYYGPLGSASASPAGPMGLVQTGQSLTPPPSLSGSNSNLALTGSYGYDYLGGRTGLYSAAPGEWGGVRRVGGEGEGWVQGKKAWERGRGAGLGSTGQCQVSGGWVGRVGYGWEEGMERRVGGEGWVWVGRGHGERRVGGLGSRLGWSVMRKWV